MRYIFYLALAIALLLASYVLGGPWGTGSANSCSQGFSPDGYAFQLAYRWQTHAGDDDEVALMQGTKQVGSYRLSDDVYRPLNASGWGKPTKPPIAPPAQRQKAAKAKACRCGDACKCGHDPCDCLQADLEPIPMPVEDKLNFGLDYIPPTDGGLRYYIGNQPRPRVELLEALAPPEVIGGPSVPDDSGKGWLVVIGDKAETAPVVSDLRSNVRLKSLLGGFRLKEYARDHWKVVKEKYDVTGHPTIYRFAKDGTYDPSKDVWKEYRGADWLADEIERKSPPVPSPNTPNGPATDYTPHACCAFGGAALTLFAMYLKRKDHP